MDTSINYIRVFISTVSGFFISWVGGIDGIFTLLLFLIGIDIITGFMKGLYLKEINPDKMFLGSLKKITIFIVVMISTQVVKYIGSELPLREITIMYYIVQEGLSSLQNISIFNSVPKELTDFFDKIDKKGE